MSVKRAVQATVIAAACPTCQRGGWLGPPAGRLTFMHVCISWMDMRRTREEAAATRAALIESALDVFADRGYAAATLVDIAARAGVTRGAAYHHFADKAELYVAALGQHWQEVPRPIWAQLDAGAAPLERVRR